jgi:hypothetical protein
MTPLTNKLLLENKIRPTPIDGIRTFLLIIAYPFASNSRDTLYSTRACSRFSSALRSRLLALRAALASIE